MQWTELRRRLLVRTYTDWAMLCANVLTGMVKSEQLANRYLNRVMHHGPSGNHQAFIFLELLTIPLNIEYG